MRLNFEEFINKERLSWEKYALLLAKIASLRSEDPFIKVGACAVRWNNSIASLGYNGAPRGVQIDWSDRDERRKRVIHAEANCLAYCSPDEIKFLAVTLLPCGNCLNLIASYGIKRVVFESVYERDDTSLLLAQEYGIKIEKYEI